MKFIAVECKEFDKSLLKEVQAVDASLVTENIVKHAIEQAELAFKRGKNISKNKLIEVIVRISAQRQIKDALKTFGIKEDTKEIVVIFEDDFDIERLKNCKKIKLSVDKEKLEKIKDLYDIKEEVKTFSPKNFEEEVEVVENLVKERIALLNID